MHYIIVFLCIIGLTQSACATQSQCPRDKAIRAEMAMDNLKDWQGVYKAYKLYSTCDDGAIWEGFSSEISSLLANSWNKIDVLIRLTKKDDSFEGFVLKHLDEIMLYEDYEKIKINISSDCPKEANELCRKIDFRLKESNSQ